MVNELQRPTDQPSVAAADDEEIIFSKVLAIEGVTGVEGVTV